MQRLKALSGGLNIHQEVLNHHKARFSQIAGRAENGMAPVAVVAHQLFQTPPSVASQLVDLLDISEGQRILEPSAGLGRLLDAMPSGVNLVAVDLSRDCCCALKTRPGLAVHEGNFLSFDPVQLGSFDRVIMNPPFTMHSDIRHVMHAIKFLKPGGMLASVVMATEHRRQAFRGWEWHDLPPGTFREANTGVDTAIVVYQK